MNTDLTVANTIMSQLGGRRFCAMTGARNILGDAKSVRFKLPNRLSPKGVNSVHITLDDNDTYTVTFYKVGDRRTAFKATVLRQVSDVYEDSLIRLFEDATGLAASL